MSSIKELFKAVASSPSITWTVGFIPPGNTPDPKVCSELDPDRHYLNVFLCAARLKYRRHGRWRVFGAVTTNVEVHHLDKNGGRFTTLISPAHFKGIDEDDVNRVVQINNRVAGPVPYRGHDLRVEAALFSVRDSDLTQPYLEAVEGFSNAFAIGLPPMAALIADPLMRSLDLLAGAGDLLSLQIGLSETFSAPREGWFLVAGAPRGTVDIDEFQVGLDNSVLRPDGSTLEDVPYILLKITATLQRADWHDIPDLGRRYDEMNRELMKGRPDLTSKAFGDWARAMATSPELHYHHASAVVSRTKAQVKEILEGLASGRPPRSLPPPDQL